MDASLLLFSKWDPFNNPNGSKSGMDPLGQMHNNSISDHQSESTSSVKSLLYGSAVLIRYKQIMKIIYGFTSYTFHLYCNV